MLDVRRRDFITLLGGAAVWPLAARAQQPGGMRRIGVLAVYGEHDPEAQVRVTAFRQALQGLGWTEGGNVVTEYRWGAGDADRARTFAAEITALKPDVILAHGTPAVTALRTATRTIPVVFVVVTDPVVPVMCKVSRGPAATLPGSARLNLKSGANGWSY